MVAEFSSFSKNFAEKAPKPKTAGLQDFLSMFDQEKEDPSKMVEQKQEEQVIVSDYLTYEKGGIITTEGFYVTKNATVKGKLRFLSEYLLFEPMTIPENEQVWLIHLFMSMNLG